VTNWQERKHGACEPLAFHVNTLARYTCGQERRLKISFFSFSLFCFPWHAEATKRLQIDLSYKSKAETQSNHFESEAAGGVVGKVSLSAAAFSFSARFPCVYAMFGVPVHANNN